MGTGFAMLSLLHSPHWFFPPLVAWVGRLPSSIATLLIYFQANTTHIIITLCPGCAVPSLSLLHSAIIAIWGRTLRFAEHPSISIELCLVKSQIDLLNDLMFFIKTLKFPSEHFDISK